MVRESAQARGSVGRWAANPIHPTAWNRHSRNFPFAGFQEVPIAPVPCVGPTIWRRAACRVYSWVMPDENAVLEELMGNLREASGRLRASRRLLLEHAMMDESRHLRLAARLSEALEVTETASREARRRRDAS